MAKLAIKHLFPCFLLRRGFDRDVFERLSARARAVSSVNITYPEGIPPFFATRG